MKGKLYGNDCYLRRTVARAYSQISGFVLLEY